MRRAYFLGFAAVLTDATTAEPSRRLLVEKGATAEAEAEARAWAKKELLAADKAGVMLKAEVDLAVAEFSAGREALRQIALEVKAAEETGGALVFTEAEVRGRAAEVLEAAVQDITQQRNGDAADLDEQIAAVKPEPVIVLDAETAAGVAAIAARRVEDMQLQAAAEALSKVAVDGPQDAPPQPDTEGSATSGVVPPPVPEPAVVMPAAVDSTTSTEVAVETEAKPAPKPSRKHHR